HRITFAQGFRVRARVAEFSLDPFHAGRCLLGSVTREARHGPFALLDQSTAHRGPNEAGRPAHEELWHSIPGRCAIRHGHSGEDGTLLLLGSRSIPSGYATSLRPRAL